MLEHAHGEQVYGGLFEALLHRAHDAIVLASVDDGLIVECSESLPELTGYPRDELLGHTECELDLIEAPVREAALRVVKQERAAGSFESWLRRRDGELRWIEFTMQLLEQQRVVLTIIRDETPRKRQEEMLRELAERDPLTHVFNRRRFVQELEQRVAESERHGDPVTLLIADLDGLKEINDRFGHLAGDEALRAVATVLQDSVRRIDSVARLGGDEFAALLTRGHRLAAERVADRLQRSLRRVRVGPGDGVPIEVSVGIAELGDSGGAAKLLADADHAMYERKHRNARR